MESSMKIEGRQTSFLLHVTDLNRSGAGVAKDENGRVIFIPFTAPGDWVKVRIIQEDKKFAHAEMITLEKPSPLRLTPPCPVFGKCGVCQWQHVPYDLQWETKVKGVIQSLKRLQIPLPSARDEIPATQIWNYRNRIQLRGEGSDLGFLQERSQKLIPIQKCEIARPEINESLPQIQREGSTKYGRYKVEVEVSPSGKIKTAWNSPHAAMGFRQVHDLQNQALKSWIHTHLTEAPILYDLFGGSGNLSFDLSSKMGQIHCVDTSISKERVKGAPAHVEFHETPVRTWLARRVKEGSKKAGSVAIIDPPRSGLRNDLPAIESSLRHLEVHQVITVGCDPDAWAKDLAGWIKQGWILKKVAWIDLFPQTTHIESLALLESLG